MSQDRTENSEKEKWDKTRVVENDLLVSRSPIKKYVRNNTDIFGYKLYNIIVYNI